MKTEDRDQELPEGAKLITEWVQVPYFPDGVVAGYPTDPGDTTIEYVMIPKCLAESGDFVIPVRGESMRDCNMHEGDDLLVRSQNMAENGQIVIAYLDGGMTVKAFYEEESGDVWLIPSNPDFNPIPVTRDSGIRILGVVTRVMPSTAPYTRLKDCAKAIRRYKNSTQNGQSSECPLLTEKVKREGRASRVMEMLQEQSKGSISQFMKELYQQELEGNVTYKNLTNVKLHQILSEYFDIRCSDESIRKYRL